MKLIEVDRVEEFAEAAAGLLTDHVRARPDLALTLPTGSTPLPLYARLREAHQRGAFSLERARVFMLDEYVDLGTYPEGSFQSDLRGALGPMVFNDRTTFFPLRPRTESDYLAAYDDELDRAGGLDLVVVGVGRNGHVGFNEPGTSALTRTHVVALTPDTLEANFADLTRDERPTRAITMGLADLLRARSVLMLVAGDKHKVARLLADGVRDVNVPATLFLDHPDAAVVVERSLL